MRRPFARTLLARIYGVGLLQLVAFGVVATGIFFVGERASLRMRERAFGAEDDVAALAVHLTDPTAMRRRVQALARSRALELSVYDESGTLVATSVTPPLSRHAPSHPHHRPFVSSRHEPPRAPPAPFFGPRRRHRHAFVQRIEHGGRVGLAVLRPAPDPLLAIPPLLTFLSAFVVVAVGSWWLTRSIERPLSALRSAARALGEGELGTRLSTSRTDEIGDLGRAFDEMAERIEHLVRAEKSLLANVSHELRTPLARIHVALDLATEGDAEAAKTAISEIAIDLAELETLVDDVLTAARLASEDERARPAELVPRCEPTAVSAITDRAIARFRSHHPERALVTELGDSDVTMFADPALIRRALDNVLDNAAKYSRDDDAPVTLVVRHDDASVTLSVEDRGIGIADEDLPRIFVPFYRADRSRTRGTGGVGLGLALAKRIVEAHGGSIVVRSRIDDGTVVELSIPRSDAKC